MRVLMVGVGALGGYIGGRLLAAARDVTLLVRVERVRALREEGLTITSAAGDIRLLDPPVISKIGEGEQFDLIILSCKAFDLDSAIEAMTPAVGPQTLILPVLNGLRHLDVLQEHFGPNAVLGGHCLISAGRDAQGHIQHFGDLKSITLGSRAEETNATVEKVAEALSVPGLDVVLSSQIMQEMWEKWVFIATGACGTSLLRSTIGDIVAAGATEVIISLLDECAAIAGKNGYAPRASSMERVRAMFTASGSTFTASMFRDIQAGARIEADHIVGDLLSRSAGVPTHILPVAFSHLKTYEARRERELSDAAAAL